MFLPFLPSKCFHRYFLVFSNSWLFSLPTVTCIYIHTYTFLNITLSVYKMLLAYVFNIDRLVLDNQLVYISLEKTLSPTLSILWLPIFLCIMLRPHGLSSIHFNMSIDVYYPCLAHLGQSCWWDVISIDFDITNWHNLIAMPLIPWFLQPHTPLYVIFLSP